MNKSGIIPLFYPLKIIVDSPPKLPAQVIELASLQPVPHAHDEELKGEEHKS